MNFNQKIVSLLKKKKLKKNDNFVNNFCLFFFKDIKKTLLEITANRKKNQ